MTFKPGIWRPIAIVLSAINLAGAGFAVASGQALHATIHTLLALAFGLWAQRMGQGSGSRGNEFQADLEALEVEVAKLRQELSETQERMDFTERLLAQRRDPDRVDPHR